MKNLTENQKEIAKTQINVNSLSQYYFDATENKAEHESWITTRYSQQINKMIDNGDLIPFVPAYDLQ